MIVLCLLALHDLSSELYDSVAGSV